jgi:hypothetical protein
MNLFINTYQDKNPERQKELIACFEKNAAFGIFNIVQLNGRPTFKDFFNDVNKITHPNDINIIANSDIYFFELNYDYFTALDHDTCYALSRWDVQQDGSAVHYNNPGSQDTWIFRGAIKMVEGANFTQGVAGCDNKIAYLLQQAGYKVINPSLTIKTYHLHNSGSRNYLRNGKPLYRLPHPRITVPVISLP